MSFKTTAILLAIFLILLGAILILEKTKSGEKKEAKLISLASDEVEKIVLNKENEAIAFEKDDKDSWQIAAPLKAPADKYEVDRLADEFSQLRIERVVEEQPADLGQYGIPRKEISLFYKGKKEPVKILIGAENPLDNTLFAKKEGETRVVLLASYLKNLIDKSVADFRKKDIFEFETGEAKSLALSVPDILWEAEKKENDWFLTRPVESLAEKYKIENILSGLSNLKAKEFVSESKTEEEAKKFGLDKADFQVTVSLPSKNQEIRFLLHKADDKVHATTSLSEKIIQVEDTILSDLTKKVEELREKDVADFYSWEACKLYVKKNGLELRVAKDKNEERWQFETDSGKEADKSKVEEFLRKLDGLEAKGFIDPPLELKAWGLEKPRAEIKIWVKEDEETEREISLLVGNEIEEEKADAGKEKRERDEPEKKNEAGGKEGKQEKAKLVVVKNARFSYLFKVDPGFLDLIPKDQAGWIKIEANKDKL